MVEVAGSATRVPARYLRLPSTVIVSVVSAEDTQYIDFEFRQVNTFPMTS